MGSLKGPTLPRIGILNGHWTALEQSVVQEPTAAVARRVALHAHRDVVDQIAPALDQLHARGIDIDGRDPARPLGRAGAQGSRRRGDEESGENEDETALRRSHGCLRRFMGGAGGESLRLSRQSYASVAQEDAVRMGCELYPSADAETTARGDRS